MGRITVFAKGSLDVRDTLHSFRSDERVVWNGINEILRVQFPGTIARVRHEVWTRSDALCEATGIVPADIAARRLPMNPYGTETQFSRALFETEADAVVLSILPDLTTQIVRHRREGYLFYPHRVETWPESDQQWLNENFSMLPLLDVDASMSNLEAIIAGIRENRDVPVLIYNVSPVVPGEWIHCHTGLEDLFSTRIRRFNLALIELSQRAGISIIDVDGLIARAGADRLKLDPVHLNAAGIRLITEEVVRVLDDLGVIHHSARV